MEGEEVNLNHELFSVWKGDHRRQDYDLVKMEMEVISQQNEQLMKRFFRFKP